MSDDDSIGERIRRHRRSRGLSLDQAAGLAGISKPYLSRLERGERSIDSRSLLFRVAEALEVSVTDLTGQPYTPHDREHAEAHRGVAAIRLALLDPDRSPRSRPTLDAFDLHLLSRECDLVAQARALPDLLHSTGQAVRETPSAENSGRAILTAHVTTFLMRNLGELDLAWIASQRTRQLAEDLDDPAWLAFAAFTQAHALAPLGATHRARKLAEDAIERTKGPTPEDVAARGSCFLIGSFVAACDQDFDAARDHLDAADRIAATYDGGSLLAKYTSFSWWNAVMHRVAVEVEAGRPAAAIAAAQPLLDRPVDSRERMSYLWVDVGRAWAQQGNHREAVSSFRRAERAAPLRVRLSPTVRDTVRDLLDEVRRRSVGAELRGLAERCGVFEG